MSRLANIIDKYKYDLANLFVLSCVAFLLYKSSLGNDFLVSWDDDLYVTANPDIKQISLNNLKKIFTTFYVGNYAPLQMLSYMIDHKIWGLRSHGFILINILLHTLNGVLLYTFFRVLSLNKWPALLGCLLFVVHPVQVESVVWISQRKNLLAMTFCLLSFLAYVCYTGSEGKKRLCFCLANILFFCALLTKSVAVVLPLAFLAYDLLVRKRNVALLRLLVEKIPFAAFAVLFASLAVISQNPVSGGGLLRNYHGGSFYATILTMITVYKDYLVNILWPTQLSAVYSPEILSGISPQVFISLAICLFMFCIPFLFARTKRGNAWFWLSLYVIFLLPVSQIIPLITLMNDRYLYFPMIGVAGFVAYCWPRDCTTKASFFNTGALVVLLIFSLLSYERTLVWKDRISLWTDATEKQESSPLAWYALGLAYDDRGQYPEAALAYEKSLGIDQNDKRVLYNLSLAYISLGSFEKAESLLLRLLKLNPDDIDTLLLLAHDYYFLNNMKSARDYYQKALFQLGDVVTVLNSLSLVEERAGNVELSQKYWVEALRRRGDRGELLLDRAKMESLARRGDEAIEILMRALSIGIDKPGRIIDDGDLEYARSLPEFGRVTKLLEKGKL